MIQNKPLRENIAKLYNNSYVQLEILFKNYRNNLSEYNRPLIRKYFTIRPELPYKPHSIDKMLSDPDFTNTVAMIIRNNKQLLLFLEDVEDEIKNLQFNINEELENQ